MKYSWILILVFLLQFHGTSAGEEFCARFVPVNVDYNEEVPDLIEFVSGKTGKRVSIVPWKRLGTSSTRVFLSDDGKYVVKIYKSDSVMGMREILLTRFFKEHHLPVSDIEDYSKNIFDPNIQVQIIVKKYIEGHTPDAGHLPIELVRESVLAGEELSNFYAKVFNQNFRIWLMRQPEYSVLREYHPDYVAKPWVDLKMRNWIIHEGHWTLIDP